jgi:hypothetical protein
MKLLKEHFLTVCTLTIRSNHVKPKTWVRYNKFRKYKKTGLQSFDKIRLNQKLNYQGECKPCLKRLYSLMRERSRTK